MAEKRVRAFLIIFAASVLLTGVGALLVHPFNPDKRCCVGPAIAASAKEGHSSTS